MLRRFSIALLIGMCFMPSSRADGIPAHAAVSVKDVYVAHMDWSGLYAGLQVGYAWADAENDFTFDSVPSVEVEADSALFGLHIGYNMQRGGYVFGIEADVEGADFDDSASSIEGLTTDAHFEADWLASIRARLGFVHDDALFYLTGGVAFTGIDIEGGELGTHLDGNSGDLTGFTIGAGVERMVRDNLTARLEYRFTSFEDFSADLPTQGGRQKVDLDMHAVRIGVSYKFGPRYEEPLK